MSNVIETLQERGFIERITDPELGSLSEKRLKEKKPLVVYCGFDPTADSLHAGNLVAILALSHFQRAGHKPIALVGGATGLIGDPSGKKDERKLQTRETVEENVAGIKKVLAKFLSFEGENAAIIVNNHDWMGPITFLDFIRDVGKHVRITEMLARDSVKARIDSGAGMSFTEFSYQLLQAYDFHHLHTHHGCDVQLGGSDQWGNITAGTDLIRRLGGEQTYGLVCPLLTTSTGQKFGKSEQGAIWLTADRTSPYQFYQYWIRTEDADVGRFLRMFTFLPLVEIEELECLTKEKPEAREAQKKLAWEMTCLVHGEEDAWNALKKSNARSIADLSVFGDQLDPSFVSSTTEGAVFEKGILLVDYLVEKNRVSSKGEARRLIKGGGIYVNEEKVESEGRILTMDDVRLPLKVIQTSKGKKEVFFDQVIGPFLIPTSTIDDEE